MFLVSFISLCQYKLCIGIFELLMRRNLFFIEFQLINVTESKNHSLQHLLNSRT